MKKLSIDALKVNSFVTEVRDEMKDTAKGGYRDTNNRACPTYYNPECSYPSIYAPCETRRGCF